MTLHSTDEENLPCPRCGQRIPMRLRDVAVLHTMTRRVPGYTWVRVILRPRWYPRSRVPMVRGIVIRYRWGPLTVMVMPKWNKVERG